MSQHDFEIANQGFPAFRSDLNSGLQALASNSAGATEPSSTYAYQFWYETDTNLLKMRNADDDAWITLAAFDQTNDEWEIRSAVIQAVDSAGVTIKNDGGTTLIQAKDDGSVVFRTDDVTIDTSGNLLVGKTSSALNTVGAELRDVGTVVGTRDSGEAAQFQRRTDDGAIVVLKNNGVTVGVIGSNTKGVTDGAYIGTDDTAFYFRPQSDAITPATATDGGDRDNAIDLGQSFARFKDLYLSGGVYLGGTGSANYLDDYEEGTYTPSVSGSTFATAEGNYVKIGRYVHCQIRLTNLSSDTTGDITITLPFTSMSVDPIGQGIPVQSASGQWDLNTTYDDVYFRVRNGVSFCQALQIDRVNGGHASFGGGASGHLNAGGQITMTFDYQTA